MSDCLEVLFVSDSSGKMPTASCFDPKIGTTLMAYRGCNGSSKRSLCIIGNDYLLSAEEAKPILHVWPLNSQEPSHDLKMVLPGKPSAVCVSPDGNYAVAGIDEKIYIWQIPSGCLLNVVSKHYQSISKIIFTQDSSHFVTAGKDGLVLVWKLAEVVVKQCGSFFQPSGNQVSPVYTFSQHSLPVMDAFIGQGNLKARLFTVSVDHICKIFCLSSGSLLLSLIFQHVLTSVCASTLETDLFVGTSSGKIYSLNIDSYPRSLEYHASDDTPNLETFLGHSAAVNCLCTSLDGKTLASGSDDGKVFLWNIPSKQLVRSFEMKDAVSNMFFYTASSNIFSSKFEPSIIVSKFEKISNLEEKNLEINVLVHENLTPITFGNEYKPEERKGPEENNFKSSLDDVGALKQEIVKLKEINKQLYQFAMTKILKNPLSVGATNGNGMELA